MNPLNELSDSEKQTEGNCCIIDNAAQRPEDQFKNRRGWDRPSPMTLTYALSSTETIDYIHRSEIFDTLGRPINRWAQFIPVSFLPVSDYDAADIEVSFYNGACNCRRDRYRLQRATVVRRTQREVGGREAPGDGADT